MSPDVDTFAISRAPDELAPNEDSVLLDAEAGIFLVADGLGGAPGGEVASQTAAETFAAYLTARDWVDREMWKTLVEATRAADYHIRKRGSADPFLKGLGTTLSALLVTENHAYTAHVGDSRIYRLRDGELRQLTTDHTLVGEMVRRHHILPEEAGEHPLRHMLSQSLGTSETLDPQCLRLDLQTGDVFVLATDGFVKVMDDLRLRTLLREAQGGAESICRTLVADAETRHPTDDLTVAVVRIAPATG